MNDQHQHWAGCLRSNALASLNDGASVRGALLSVNNAYGVVAAHFLSLEVAKLSPRLNSDSLSAHLKPLVATHEHSVQSLFLASLERYLQARGQSGVDCAGARLGISRRPMSNALTLVVATDKLNRDPDQFWCSVSIDLDRPAGRVVPLYGSHLSTGINRQVGAGVLVSSAESYEELFPRLSAHIAESISANDLDEQPALSGLALPFSEKRPCHA